MDTGEREDATIRNEKKPKTKIEKKAVRTVEAYIDDGCTKLEYNIFTNDKTPFWDGEIFVYKNRRHANDNFVARVPIQVKGTTNIKKNPLESNVNISKDIGPIEDVLFFLFKREKNRPRYFMQC